MGEQSQGLFLRISPDLVARIDAYAVRLQAQHPGLPISRSSTIRSLVIEGLDRAGIGKVVEAPAAAPAPPPKRPGAYIARVLEASNKKLVGQTYEIFKEGRGWHWSALGSYVFSPKEPTHSQAIMDLMNIVGVYQLEELSPDGKTEEWTPELVAAVVEEEKNRAGRRRTKKAGG